MMAKKILVLITILCLLQIDVQAQWRKSWAFDFGGQYGLSLVDKVDFYRSNRAMQMQTSGMAINGDYYISPKFALGVGFSSNAFLNSEKRNISSISINFQRDITRSWFVQSKVSFATSFSDLNEAYSFNLGAGYRLWQSQSGWSLNGSFACHIINYAYDWYLPKSVSVYEQRFNFGLSANVSIEYTFASLLPQGELEETIRNDNKKRFWFTEAILFLFGFGSSR